MYPDAGPSRTSSGYSRDAPAPRQTSGRYELDYDDRGSGFGRGHETPNRALPASSPWSRPPPRASFRPYPNGPPRARTPSPPRQSSEWDRERPRLRAGSRERERERPMDVRDRLSLDAPYRASPGGFSEPTRRPGPFGAVPTARDIGRDQPAWDRERRWGTSREDRYASDETRSQPRRSFSPNKQSVPYPRDRISNPSPPKPRPGPPSTPWNGTARNPPPSRSSFQTPRDRDDRDRPHSDRTPFPAREISGDFGRSAEGGPGPNISAYQASTRSSPAGTPPKQLRSLRGSSSPVESRHPHRSMEDPGRSVAVSAPATDIKKEVEEGELEEGEVVSSPVRPDRDLPLARQLDLTPSVQVRDRYRDWPARREPFDRNREIQRRWPSQQQQQVADRPPVRGPNDPVQANQPWRNGQSVDDGWGRRKRPEEAGRSRSVDRDEKPSPVQRRSSHGQLPDREGIKEEPDQVQAEVEDEDRPLTPPLPPQAETLTTRRVSINTSLALPRLASEDPDRPDTPALPAFLQNSMSTSGSQSLGHQDTPPDSLEEPASDPLPPVERPPTPQRSPPPTAPDSVQHHDERIGVSLPTGEDGINEVARLDTQLDIAMAATPDTPALPTSVPVSAINAEVLPIDGKLAIPDKPDVTASPTAEKAEDLVEEVDTGADTIPTDAPILDIPMITPDLAPTPRAPFSPLLTSKPRSPAARQPTLAERRSIVLPPTQGSLSSPFGERMLRRDPAPTNDSLQESTDTEPFPRTADIEEPGSETDEDAPMSRREARLISAMKFAQSRDKGLDVEAIMAWNLAAAPSSNGRTDYELSPEGREKRLRQVTWPLGRQQKAVAQLVAKQVAREHNRTSARVEALQKEYQMLDEEWKEHCDYLDTLMEKRGPPPESLYAVPNAVPVVTPGPAPTTPVALPEDLLSTRAIRRRGAGDAVTTEAEFQEILAAMADTAAKDPNYRASKTTAYVPDMLSSEERRLRFEDDNDLVEDPIAFYDFKGIAEPIWTEEERSIFVRRYLNFPKQFGKIAEALPDKTASDCVLYYYRTKKEVDYKSMLASRRGVTRRKALPIKKGGKSAALLASLDQKKATVESTPMRAVPTPGRLKEDTASSIPGSAARRGKPRLESNVMRRRIADVQAEAQAAERDRAGTPDQPQTRDGSELPTTAAMSKGKIRMSMKGPKRPRMSSVSGGPNTPGVSLNLDGQPGIDNTLTPTSELLPPVKRARKSRKSTATSDLTELTDPSSVAPSTTSSARRSTTTSYWSVDEKRRLKDLLLVHGRDFRAIAAELPGKTERQIGNQIQMRPAEYGFDPATFADMDMTPGSTPYSQKDEYFKPSAGYSRSIYDVYSQQPAGYGHHEPRLGVFPSLPPSHPVTASAAPPPLPGSFDASTKPAPRAGGMRISALLNDEPSQMSDMRRDGGDAMSDGTVEDRDEGVRPSPRGIPPVPQARRPSSSQEHRPEYDRYRSSAQGPGYIYHPAPVPSSAWQPRPGVAYYSRPVSPPPARPTHSHSVPPTYQSAPTHLPPRSSGEYYRQRPETYRAQSTSVVEAYRSYPPPPHHLPPQQHPGQSTTPPLPPTSVYAGRYDQHPHQAEWRGYQQPPQQHHGPSQQYSEQRRMSIHHAPPLQPHQATSASAPTPRQPEWHSSPEGQKMTLPGIRNMIEANEPAREG